MRRIALLLSLLAVVGAQPVRAQTLPVLVISGIVTDPRGVPFEGAYVTGGFGEAVRSGPDGSYELQQTGFGTYDVHASWYGMWKTRIVTLSPLNPNARLDLQMRYGIDAYPGAFYVNPRLGRPSIAASLRASQNAVPGTPGQAGRDCATLFDPRSGTPVFMTYAGFDGWRHRWEITVTSQTDPDGRYDLVMDLVDCGSSASLSHGPDTTHFLVDTTPPVVVRAFPNAPSGQDPFVGVEYERDLSGVDSRTVSLTIDGVAMEGSHRSSSTYPGPIKIGYDVRGLAGGDHTAVFTLGDYAGNMTTTSFEFTVDATAPTIANPTPTGTIASFSPEIAVDVADASAGIDPSGVVMTISDGLRSARVDATYDPESGRIVWQVPATVAGPNLGSSPLTPGTYRVDVAVSDRGANTSQIAWTFTVGP